MSDKFSDHPLDVKSSRKQKGKQNYKELLNKIEKVRNMLTNL